jgi:hypothetical protein
MSEICFRYGEADLADSVAEDLVRVAPEAGVPFRDATRSAVLHVPDSLWQMPMVPELTLGLGGRLVDCAPVEPDGVERGSTGGTDDAGTC